MKNVKYLFISIIVTFQFSCVPSVSFMNYTETKYKPTSSVNVVRKNTIDRKFIELGELSVKITKDLIYNNEEDAVMQLKEKAKTIGADAIIIIWEEKETILKDDEIRYVKAIAIKYI